jgi:hypothetical protein
VEMWLIFTVAHGLAYPLASSVCRSSPAAARIPASYRRTPLFFFILSGAEMGNQSSDRIHKSAVPGACQLPKGIGQVASGGSLLRQEPA